MAEEISEAKIYWIQFIITIIFGFFIYYSLDLGWISTGTNDYFIILLIHLVFDIIIPLLYLKFLIKHDFWTALKASTKNIGTNFILINVICALVFIINIQVGL
ncbi:MAG: hypothetical protein EU551_03230 [Promethearchaeota archaeon]|nr:MAG: hypothetical protein EU551_03230 [Candidatus Lokiarchaeota archaeon]